MPARIPAVNSFMVLECCRRFLLVKTTELMIVVTTLRTFGLLRTELHFHIADVPVDSSTSLTIVRNKA
jgi:hypothetical protein